MIHKHNTTACTNLGEILVGVGFLEGAEGALLLGVALDSAAAENVGQEAPDQRQGGRWTGQERARLVLGKQLCQYENEQPNRFGLIFRTHRS